MSSAKSIFAALTPADLGLPPKFARYRLHQREALDWLHACTAGISAALLPTGAGKTAIAISLARWLGVKAVYLVATKALQSQVLSDFASMGMRDVRGRANYSCPNYENCDDGSENGCSLSGTSGCLYACAVDNASESDLVVTNYAYWLASGGPDNRAFERIGLLVCDEAHAIEAQLTSFASVKLSQRELEYPRVSVDQSGSMNTDDPQFAAWVDWVRQVLVRCTNTKTAVERLSAKHGTSARKDDRWIEAEDLEQRVSKILRMNGNWVWQFDDRGGCSFVPVRLGGFTRALFGAADRTLLMSASLNEFTMRLLMKDEPYDYRAWPQVFNPAGAPVYHLPVRKLNWRSTDEDYKAVIEAADTVMDYRRDRKGIIHTVSYARSRLALQYSRHAQRFIWNETSRDLSDRLKQFRAAPPETGSILVTPSVEEGFDFPGDQAEHQHFIKFPFPNETQRVIAERCKQIPGYRLNYAATKLNQMCGRPRRFEADRCENFIYDKSVAQLTGPEGRSYLPPGFRIFTVTAAPPPPPRIQ